MSDDTWQIVKEKLNELDLRTKEFERWAEAAQIRIESTPKESFWQLAYGYVEALALIIGDSEGWLLWFCFDNDFGRKEQEAAVDGGKLEPIRCFDDLKVFFNE